MNAKSNASLMDGLLGKIVVSQKVLIPVNPADKFAGTWAGTMSYANFSRKSDIVMTILRRAKPGKVCGKLEDRTAGLVWELTLGDVGGNVLSYSCSKILQDDCPVREVGKLILRPDGTLYRVHQVADSLLSGTLTKF